MSTTKEIELKNLRPGHEFPGASINARKTDPTAGVDSMANSIGRKGVLESVLVVASPKDDGLFYVANGNRRLFGLRKLLKEKKTIRGQKFGDDLLVAAIVSPETDPVKALELSLETAQEHVALHPVDQFEVFAQCLDRGDPPEKIAADRALPLKAVKQRLALAKLSPVIRDAWRSGKINAETAEAYAVSAHHSQQEKLFKRGGWEATNAHQIRRHMIGDEQESARLMKFVGEAAYKAAGGAIREDLFGTQKGAKGFADFGLLQRLANDKLKEKAKEFEGKGWGWAAVLDDLPGAARFEWPTKQHPTAEEKKKLGVILSLTYTGTVEIKTGVVKPGVRGIDTADKTKGKKGKPKQEGLISNSLAQRLSEALTFAARDAIVHEPELAFSLALAALTNNSFDNGPVEIKATGLGAKHGGKYNPDAIEEEEDPDETTFAQVLPDVVKLATKDKIATLARIVGRSFNFQTQSAERLPLDEPEVVAIVKAMDPKRLHNAIREKLDAEDYFASVSGAMRLQAIREMAPPVEAAAAKMKKPGQVAAAVEAYASCKTWLPPELRGPGYAGPKAKPAAPPPKAKGGKKKPAAKKVAKKAAKKKAR